MILRELRKQKKLTQVKCARYLGIPLRTYQNYETDPRKQDTLKYVYMVQKLDQYGFIDENHGILSVQKIKEVCNSIFSSYDVNYAYLFGSYAIGKATESSDVDLLISGTVSGMKFYELVEELREALKKKVDLLNVEQLKDNLPLTDEILKDGIKVYG